MPPTSSTTKRRKPSGESSRAATQKKRSKTVGTGGGSRSEALRKVTIQVQKPNSDVDPILVSFPGGAPSQDSPPQFQWSKLNPKSVAGRVVEGRDKGGCVYKASCQGMGYDERRTKLCVGVYDKQTGVLTVHQAASRGTVYSLQQHLPTYKEELQPEITGVNTGSNLALFADFGSAKKQKVLKSQQANRVDIDTVIGTGKAMVDVMLGDDDNDGQSNKPGRMSESNRKAVEEARKSGSEKVVSPEQQAVDNLRKQLLPPFNLSTNKPCEIYRFQDIVGEDGWEVICKMVHFGLRSDDKNFYEAITQGRPDDDGRVKIPEQRGWSASVLDCLKRVATEQATEARGEDSNVAKSSASATHQLRCILLFHNLLKFYTKFFKKGGDRSFIVPGLGEDQPRWLGIHRKIALGLFQEFATQTDSKKQTSVLPDDDRQGREIGPNVPWYVMDSNKRDKCLVHLLLVYLMARGGSKMMVDDLSLVIKDLGLDNNSTAVEKRLRTAGVTLSKSNAKGSKKTKAILTAPLKFPKTAMMRKGGRK